MAEREKSTGFATICDRNFQEAVEALGERERDIEKFRAQVKELLYINHQWDEEYKELKQKYHQYRADAQLSQRENQTLIARLKMEKQAIVDRMKDIEAEKDRLATKFSDLRAKYDHQKRQYIETLSQLKSVSAKYKDFQSSIPPLSPPCVNDVGLQTELKEQNALLTTQLQAYKEDFEAEKRDKDRLRYEKDTQKLRHEAEIASFKIQIDRLSGELARFKTEAVRLGQQLRLKQKEDDEKYRKHLESQGYVPRYPNQPLPPLDPFVENDRQTMFSTHQVSGSTSTPPASPRISTVVQQSGSGNAQYTRRPSLGYQTHMSDTQLPTTPPLRTPPIYNTTSHYNDQLPLNDIQSTNHGSTFSQNTGISKQESCEPSTSSLRSVSPQIHRIGGLQLFSRELGSEEDSSYPKVNDLDTNYSVSQPRQTQCDRDLFSPSKSLMHTPYSHQIHVPPNFGMYGSIDDKLQYQRHGHVSLDRFRRHSDTSITHPELNFSSLQNISL